MRPHVSTVIASTLVALEGIAVMVLAGTQVVAITQHDTANPVSAWALVVLTVVFGVGVLAFAYGVFRRRTWGRSGAIVAQLLTGAVALGAATGQFAEPVVAVFIAIPALVTFVAVLVSSKYDGEDGLRAETRSDADQ